MIPTRAVLIATTAGARLALDARDVSGVRGVPQTTPLPHAPPHLLGVFHHEGKVLPLFDLIAYARGDTRTDRPRLVIARAGEHEIGLLVEDVLEMLPLPQTVLDKNDASLPAGLARLVQGRLAPGAGDAATGPGMDPAGSASGPTRSDVPGHEQDPELRRRLEEILEDAPEWLRRIHLQDGKEREKTRLQRAQETLSSDPPVHLVDMDRLVKALCHPIAAPVRSGPA